LEVGGEDVGVLPWGGGPLLCARPVKASALLLVTEMIGLMPARPSGREGICLSESPWMPCACASGPASAGSARVGLVLGTPRPRGQSASSRRSYK
jgi:hypothetical protein